MKFLARFILALVIGVTMAAFIPAGSAVHAEPGDDHAKETAAAKKIADDATAYCKKNKAKGETQKECETRRIADATKDAQAAEKAREKAKIKAQQTAFCKENKVKGESLSKCVARRTALKLKEAAAAAATTTTGVAGTTQNKLGTPNSLGIPAVSDTGVISNIVILLSIIVGAVSTIFLAVGGVRYSASNGNPKQIEGAKSTITYAIVGLVVSILAGGIVGFVIGAIG